MSVSGLPSQNLPANVPLGALPGGYAQVTASQSGITTVTDLTGLTATVTVSAGRRIRITGSLAVGTTVANDIVRMSIKEGATVLQIRDAIGVTTTGNVNLEASIVLTPSAGSHTYKLTLERLAGTGTESITAGTTFPNFILIEDIGV